MCGQAVERAALRIEVPEHDFKLDRMKYLKMERIWAPWRIDYVVGGKKEPGCIFCNKPASREDDDNLIVHRARSIHDDE